MRRLGLFVLTLTALCGTMLLAGAGNLASDFFQVDKGEINPWTHLNFQRNEADFQFAIVTDRTGGHRSLVFEKAVRKLNLLHPEFVISVGDLIEGYSEDPLRIEQEWKEFQNYTSQLQMPFFYVPGNHDISNNKMLAEWQTRFGRSYYHFVYQNTLFLAVNSEQTPGSKLEKLGDEQLAYFQKVIADNPNPRWTFVFMHKPLWTYGSDGKGAGTGFNDLEKLLEGKKFTVFCGHEHRYVPFKRNGNDYIQLATTGGSSQMRGKQFGEFDQFAWLTMTKDGPIISNVLLDGVIEVDLQADLKFDAEMQAAQKEQQAARDEARRKRAEEEAKKKKAAEEKAAQKKAE